MTGGDYLAREHAAAVAALSDAQREELVLAGVDRVDIAGMVGVAYGRVVGDRFEPHPGGELALCTPVRVDPLYPLSLETPVPERALRVGDIIDLVYWHPRYPRDWAVRKGVAEVLGLVPPHYCDPEPVEIWRGPLNWFRAGCRGLVLLSREPADVYRVLSLCSCGIVAEDEQHRRELVAALERPFTHPPVTVQCTTEPYRAI